MKIVFNGKQYGFVWGTRCFINAEKFLDIDVNFLLVKLDSPSVLTVLIYEGLNLWCDKNNVDRPFLDYEEFLDNYDKLGDEKVYGYIVTDIMESVYAGAPVVKHLEKVYKIDEEDFKKQKLAKKKYLTALGK